MMQRKKSSEEKIRIVQMTFGILMSVVIQLIPYADRGNYYGIWELVKQLMGEREWHIVYGIVGVMEFFTCLYLIRFIFLMRHKDVGILYKLPAVLFFTDAIIMMYMGQLYFIIPLPLVIFEFMYIRYLEEKEEIEERYVKAKEKEEKFRKRRKQALFFPGHYPKELSQMIRKIWKTQIQVQILLILSEIFLVVILYFVFAVYQMLEKNYTLESSITGEGIYGLFRSLGIILGLCCVIMLTMMFSWFIKEQKKEYRILTILGIRRYTAWRIFLEGMAGNAVLAVVPGLAVGYTLSLLFGNSLEMKHMINAMVVMETSVGYILILLIALGLNQEGILSLGENTERNAEKKEEKRPGREWIFLFGLGMVFFLLGVWWYSMREWAESIYIHALSVLGIFFTMAGGMGWYAKRKSRSDAKIFNRRPLQRYFRSNFSRIFFLTLLYFCLLGVFTPPFASSLMKQDVEEMYPYDIICMVYQEDMEWICQVGDTYNVKITPYPMIRTTSLYGSDSQLLQRGDRTIKWPQGQHVAISESVYRELRKKAGLSDRSLDLQGEDMHIVYQQNVSVKAHTIDWDTTRMEDRLRFGQPLQYYNADNFKQIFPSRNIVSEERACLTGSFHQGMQENLVVLSDKFFQREYEKICSYNAEHMNERNNMTMAEWKSYTMTHTSNLTEGPTVLLCINVPKNSEKGFLKELSTLDENYKFDQIWDRNIRPYYVKKEMVSNMHSEIHFTKIVYGFILAIVYGMAVFQYGVKIQMESEKWEWENHFLRLMGMKKKERKRKLQYQIRILTWIPTLSGAVSGVVFLALTGKARLFTNQEMTEYMGISLLIYGTVFVSGFIISRLFLWSIWRKMER